MNIRISIRDLVYNKSLFVFFVFVGLLPATNIGYAFPLQYFFIPFWIFVIAINLNKGFDRNVSFIFFSLLLLTLYIFLNALIIGSLKTGILRVNADFIPYLFKLITFAGVFFLVLKTKSITPENLHKIFLIFGIIAMSISLLQWLPLPFSKFLTELYAYKDTTIEIATREVLWTKRVQGFAFHPTATGGAGAFFFILGFYSLFVHKKNQVLALTLILLSVSSTAIFCQARMGTLTIAFALILIGLYSLRRTRDIRYLINAIIALIIIVILIIVLTDIENNIYYKQFIYRWDKLIEQSQQGGNRIRQIVFALEQLKSPFDYLFGISRPFQNTFQRFHIEVEPFYIFVIYGLLGVVLAYLPLSIIYLIIKPKLKIYKKPISSLTTLNLASRVMIISYFFFSVGYYFYRENYIPLIPWIFWSAVLALNYRKKEKSLTLNN